MSVLFRWEGFGRNAWSQQEKVHKYPIPKNIPKNPNIAEHDKICYDYWTGMPILGQNVFNKRC